MGECRRAWLPPFCALSATNCARGRTQAGSGGATCCVCVSVMSGCHWRMPVWGVLSQTLGVWNVYCALRQCG